MDASSDRSSPRSRQLQGPRPPPLAVSKDSHKVRKPPVAPHPRHHHLQPASQQQQQHHHQQQQARAPVIIYDASPKVIHTKPGDFMALVQRLTGPGAGASAAPAQFDAAAGAGPSTAPPVPLEFQPREFLLSPTAALSPAARLAAIERSVRPLPPAPAPSYFADDYSTSFAADMDSFAAVLGPPSVRPGILSPAALPPAASTGLFSPLPFDPSCLSWLGELSPFLPSAGAARAAAGLEAPFAPSPCSSLLLATPTMPSPATFSVLEFFSNFPDL
ncbi:protein MKS1-like [Phragmites australis]|uniref:protein MKS1-like n=1 Tax=Phragmites australis TaxID=29695 RepID=UPI002D77FF90|nr:protein MKS1-like [Phragmites australis]